MRRLFVIGHPGLYGGAGTELHHQILLWLTMPNIEIHIIPLYPNFENEPLYKTMLDLGVTYHKQRSYKEIRDDDAVINFCSKTFLGELKFIKNRTRRIVFVNCMSHLFAKEKEAAKADLISHFLYQRQDLCDQFKEELISCGSTAEFMSFKPYFHKNNINFVEKSDHQFVIGHISRANVSKFNKSTLYVYDRILSPVKKRGIFLGYEDSISKKIGKPWHWIKTYANHKEFPVDKFYESVNIIVQPTDTNENWPRVGFEAMNAGVPLVVDNKGGWKYMIDHGVSGFLCDTPEDFAYYASRLAFEPELMKSVIENAKIKGESMSSAEVSAESWNLVFDSIFS